MEHSFESGDENKEKGLSTPASEESKEDSTQDLKQEPAEETPDEDTGNWVTGLPLVIILGAICLVCFLMLLDTSIIVTVRGKARI